MFVSIIFSTFMIYFEKGLKRRGISNKLEQTPKSNEMLKVSKMEKHVKTYGKMKMTQGETRAGGELTFT